MISTSKPTSPMSIPSKPSTPVLLMHSDVYGKDTNSLVYNMKLQSSPRNQMSQTNNIQTPNFVRRQGLSTNQTVVNSPSMGMYYQSSMQSPKSMLPPNIMNRPELWPQIEQLLREQNNKTQVNQQKASTIFKLQENKKSFIQEPYIPQNISQQPIIRNQQRNLNKVSSMPIMKSQFISNQQLRPSNAALNFQKTSQMHHMHQMHNMNQMNQMQHMQNDYCIPNQPPKCVSRFEYIPYKKKIVQMQQQEIRKVIWVPVEKQVLDYYTVEHITQYQVKPYEEIIVQQVPIEKVQTKVQYQLVQKKIVHMPDSCYDRSLAQHAHHQNLNMKQHNQQTAINFLSEKHMHQEYQGAQSTPFIVDNQAYNEDQRQGSTHYIANKSNNQIGSTQFIQSNQFGNNHQDQAQFILDSQNKKFSGVHESNSNSHQSIQRL